MFNRFVPFDGRPGTTNLIICLDAEFWSANMYEILDYIRLNNGAHIGDRVLWFKTDCDRTLFLLKWN